MNKIIVFNQEAKQALKRGIDSLANAVRVTLGPEGKTVILASYKDNKATITKDGVSVARQVFLKDPVENAAAQIVKEVANKTAEDAGDGTTTATVLAQALITNCIDKNLTSKFFKQLLEDKDAVIENIKSQSKKISSEDTVSLINVASISANNDKEIGKLVAEAIQKTGKHGIVTAEEGDSFETKIVLKKGLNFESGFISPLFINDTDKLECELSNCCIFMYDEELTRIEDVLPQIRFANARKKSLLVVAPDIHGDALSVLLSQKNQGFKCAAVKSPSFGEYRKSLMVDIATLTGGVVVESQKRVNFTELLESHYGFAERVIITKDETTIVEGKGKTEKIEQRVNQLEKQIENTGNEYEVRIMKERIAKLQGGIAVIKVGGYSEIEIKEKKDRIEDAIFAVKAALLEGIVEGGGIAYLRAKDLCKTKELQEALSTPFVQIMTNAGTLDIPALQNNIVQKYIPGINAKTGKIVNMYDEGIIDPLKVTRVALENAVSIAVTFLTTECIIVDE